MPGVEEEALRLIGLIYEAALDKQKWGHLIGEMVKAIDGQGGMIRLVDYTRKDVGYFEGVGYEDSFVQAYRDHFIAIDAFRQPLETRPVGQILLVSRDLGPNQFRNSEFYNDYLRPQDKEFAAGTALVRSETSSVQIGLHRGKCVGDFKPEHLQLLNLVFPHLARAIQIHRLLEETSTRADMAYLSLEHLRVGVILLDANQKAVYLNREAERLTASGFLELGPEGPRLKEQACTARLRQIIAYAIHPKAGLSLMGGGEMRQVDSDGKTLLEFRVIPLSKKSSIVLHSAPACAAIFISRPGALRLPWQKVAAQYGLTKSEAKLAVLLAEGETLERAAHQLSISIHTARSHLKSVFAKTGMSRQPELVAMLLRGVLALFNEGEEE